MTILSTPRSPSDGMPPERLIRAPGPVGRLMLFTTGALAFLAVVALAVALSAGAVAKDWTGQMARTSTLRLPAPPDTEITAAALRLLQSTPGIAGARALSSEEVQTLLAPWFGADLPVAGLPIPQLIAIMTTEAGYDAAALTARLAAELPGAMLDDHARWPAPLISAAQRIRLIAGVSLALIALSTAAMVTLADRAVLAANGQGITLLRQIGATDGYIASAFIRRPVQSTLIGAVLGTLAGALALALIPRIGPQIGPQIGIEGLSAGATFRGRIWLWLPLIPLCAAGLAWIAARATTFRALRRNPKENR